MGAVKTTIEIPDADFRNAKAAAAIRGQSLKDFVAEAVRNHLRKGAPEPEKRWAKAFGGLRDLHRETRRVERLISAEFESIDEEQWR